MTSDLLLTLYHRLPSALQSAAATAQGLSLRSWRYGPDKGDGALEAMRREIVKLGLEGAVGFAGAVAHEEIARYLAGADIFLNTTSFDNTPVRRSGVLEAMASGLCIVSTNVGGVPFLLEDGRDARWCRGTTSPPCRLPSSGSSPSPTSPGGSRRGRATRQNDSIGPLSCRSGGRCWREGANARD